VPDYYLAVKEGLQIVLNVPQQAIRVQLLAEAVPLWTHLADAEQRYRLWCDTMQRPITAAARRAALPRRADACRGRNCRDSALRDIARILGVR
jgi:hypothetical protein